MEGSDALRSIHDVAWAVSEMLRTSPALRVRFGDMIDQLLRPIGEASARNMDRSTADDVAFMDMVNRLEATADPIPPTAEHVFRPYRKADGTTGGAWWLPNRPIDVAEMDRDSLPYQYAILAAAHQAFCTTGPQHERHNAIWTKPAGNAGRVEASMVFAWGWLVKAVTTPHSENAMLANLRGAFSRVRADLATLSDTNQPFGGLLSAFDRFYKTLDATTVPAEVGGRTVGGIAHAIALSEATSALYGEMKATSVRLFQQHGRSLAEYPPGVELMESDSPEGPWTPIPASAITGAIMGIGRNGADAVLLAALESATKIAAFPIDKWNTMQAAHPGGDHQRFHAGDVVSAADLAALESAAKLLRMKATPASPTVSATPRQSDHPQREGTGVDSHTLDTVAERAAAKVIAATVARDHGEQSEQTSQARWTPETAQQTVNDYIRERRGTGIDIERLTRDGISAATGVPKGSVSGTGAWKALAAEKRQALAKPPRTDVVATNVAEGIDSGRVDRETEIARLVADQNADKRSSGSQRAARRAPSERRQTPS